MAKQRIEKTNVARLLDNAKVAYSLIPYTVDENNLAATHVAEELGEDIATVFKTLVLHGDRSGYLVCVVPGDYEVDLKAAAKVSGNKKVEFLSEEYGQAEEGEEPTEATVAVNVVYADGTTQEEYCDVVLIDGKWLVNASLDSK